MDEAMYLTDDRDLPLEDQRALKIFQQRSQARHTALPNSMFTTLRK